MLQRPSRRQKYSRYVNSGPKMQIFNSPRKSKHKTTAMQYTNEPMKYLVGEKVILLLAIIVQALF